MVYVLLANGFEEIEAITVIDVLRRADIDVVTVGIGNQVVTGSHDITVDATIDDSEIFPKNIEMVVLPGGMPGTMNLGKSKVVRNLLETAASDDKYIAAICAAPSLLGEMGLLEGKKAVCFPGFEKRLKGAIYTDQAVVQDGRVITSKGPGTALPFALKLVEILRGKGISEKIGSSMQCTILI